MGSRKDFKGFVKENNESFIGAFKIGKKFKLQVERILIWLKTEIDLMRLNLR